MMFQSATLVKKKEHKSIEQINTKKPSVLKHKTYSNKCIFCIVQSATWQIHCGPSAVSYVHMKFHPS